MSFGENLRNVRKKRNITQEDLAETLGVSRQAISKWESD
ncbi:MAG: helix-turn-helix transcriptional regulator, partial [Lachnospiraceae bacterium]|nr:helix-turn-helix transcriptional regulator [Lachnospiraceae bacterium]